MSIKGREGLSLVFESQWYKDWAKITINKTDAGKLASEFAGIRKTSCSSKFAQGLQILCRENPPPLVPPPPALASIWLADAAFTNGSLSNFAGPARTRARATGWSVVYVQMLHTPYAASNEAEIPTFLGAGWKIVGWGTYGQGSDPYEDGRAAAVICKRIPQMVGWKANGEAWAEGEHSWKTEAFINGWRAEGAPVPLGWSVLSSDTANFARNFAYQTALSVEGSDIDIQVYGATYPTYTVGAGNGMLTKASVPENRRSMTFDIDGDGTGPFSDYLTWKGPRRLWQPDRATVATFDALVR